MMDCDTLLMVGSSFPYSEFLPEEGQARGVQIDLDGRMLGIRYPMEVNLVGDSAADAARADPAAGAQERPLLAGADRRRGRRLVEADRDARAQRRRPDQPAARVLGALPAAARPARSSTSDSGSSANWFARDVRLRDGMMASLSGTLATMGPGVPYAIAAKFAHPDRPVIALVGDGAMQMNGNGELVTIAKYWRALERPAADRARAEQPRPQPGHLGAARDGGRPAATRPRSSCPTSPTPATPS